MRALATCSLLVTLAACGGGAPKGPPPPAPTAATGTFGLTVHKTQSKPKHYRVWITLTNKTDQTLDVDYQDFLIEVGGTSYPCALRVPFTRVTKSFPMAPKMVKRFSGPLEALAVPTEGNATLKLTRYRVGDETKPSTLSIALPIESMKYE